MLKPGEKKNKRTNYLTIILNAPRGVTRTAGANAYATKFETSPTITKPNTINKTMKNLYPVSISNAASLDNK